MGKRLQSKVTNKDRVLSMEYPILIAHYNLIVIGKSSQSSAVRGMVTRRINVLLKQGKISNEQLDSSLAHLKRKFDVK